MLSHFDMKGAWKKAEEGWRKYLASKHTWRCEDGEFTCSMNLKGLLRAAEKEKEFLNGQVTSEIQPQSASYESVLREPEVQYRQTSQRFKVIEFHEARLRIQLQTEESMIFSIHTKL